MVQGRRCKKKRGNRNGTRDSKKQLNAAFIDCSTGGGRGGTHALHAAAMSGDGGRSRTLSSLEKRRDVALAPKLVPNPFSWLPHAPNFLYFTRPVNVFLPSYTLLLSALSSGMIVIY